MGTYTAGLTPFEIQLMTRIQRSEEGAFQELFDQFRGRIYRTALRILKEEESAWDALQETFINVFRAAKCFRGDSKLGTWINRITINVCLEMIRKNKKHRNQTDEDISEDVNLEDRAAYTPEESFHTQEIRDRVQLALSRLSRRHQSVVRLHDLEGFTIREIALQLSVAEGTIKSRLFYGRQELKKILEQAQK